MYNYSRDGVTVAAMIDTRTANAGGKYPAKIRVNYKRVRQYYSTGKSFTPEEWKRLPKERSRDSKSIREEIESSFYLIRDNVYFLLERGEFSYHTLNTRLGKSLGDTFSNALKSKICLLEKEERIGTRHLYKETLRLVTEFAGEQIPFHAITPSWLKRCESYWLRTGKGYTSIGMYMRNIRAIINEARRAGVLKDSQYPFGKGKYEIKTRESKKRALNAEQLALLWNYSDGLQASEKYRDLWFFSYFFNGINIADLVGLKFSDITEGEISFVRQKTKRTSKTLKKINVIITPEMKEIIGKWGNKPGSGTYIFPYLKGDETATQRKKISMDLTRRIKMIADAVGLGRESISTYTARHSYATMLKRSGANIAYISESLGHNDMKTTEHYLANFEQDERRKNSQLLAGFIGK